MTAARLPSRLTRLTHLTAKLFEEVLSAGKPTKDHSRTDVRRDDQFHLAGSESIAIGPAAVRDLLDHFGTAAAASATGTSTDFRVFRSTNSTMPLASFLPITIRYGIPIRSASLNLTPGRSSRSSSSASRP